MKCTHCSCEIEESELDDEVICINCLIALEDDAHDWSEFNLSGEI